MSKFNESLELLERMNRLNLNAGEREYLNEQADNDTVNRGVIRKVRYELQDRRLKISYMGKIEYFELPAMISSRSAIFDFVDSLLQELNSTIHPIKFEKKESKKKEEPEEESPEEPEEKPEEGEEEE